VCNKKGLFSVERERELLAFSHRRRPTGRSERFVTHPRTTAAAAALASAVAAAGKASVCVGKRSPLRIMTAVGRGGGCRRRFQLGGTAIITRKAKQPKRERGKHAEPLRVIKRPRLFFSGLFQGSLSLFNCLSLLPFFRGVQILNGSLRWSRSRSNFSCIRRSGEKAGKHNEEGEMEGKKEEEGGYLTKESPFYIYTENFRGSLNAPFSSSSFFLSSKANGS